LYRSTFSQVSAALAEQFGLILQCEIALGVFVSRAESSPCASIASSMALKCRIESFVPLPFPRGSQKLLVALYFAGLVLWHLLPVFSE